MKTTLMGTLRPTPAPTTTLGNTISVKLPVDIEAQLRASAEATGETFGVYLRNILVGTAEKAEAFASLQHAIDMLTIAQSRTQDINPATLEMLLLLRAISPPEKLRAVHADMSRLGLAVWSGEKTYGA